MNLGPLDCIKDSVNPCEDCEEFGIEMFYNYRENEDASIFGNIIGDELIGSGLYELEDIFGNHANSLNNLRYTSSVFIGNLFNNSGTAACMDAGGTAKAPWGWQQFTYSNEELKQFECQALGGNCGAFTIVHNPYSPIVITEDTEWDNNFHGQVGTVVINVGKKLTINNTTITMSRGAKIKLEPHAELEINNSLVTTCNEDVIWGGIDTDGISSIIINGSTIENAVVGINLDLETLYNFYSEHNLTVSNGTIFRNNEFMDIRAINHITQYGGEGIINLNIEDSRFENSRIAMYSEFLTQGARRKGNRFLDCEIGVYVDRCEELILEDNLFNNCSEQGIYSIDSYLNMPTSTFTNNKRGVTIESRFPIFTGARIGGGQGDLVTFRNNELGLVSFAGRTNLGVNVTNCFFDNNMRAGAAFYGENKVQFKNNTINNAMFGVVASATGGAFNEFNCNQYQTNGYSGIADKVISNENIRTVFLENDFDGGSFVDIGLFNADLLDEIGEPTNPAANCFSDVSNGDDDPLNNSLFVRNSEQFNYHYFDNSQSNNCEEPPSALSYTKVKSLVRGDNCQNGIGIFGLIDPDGDGTKGYDSPDDIPTNICKSCVKSAIQTLIIKIKNQGGDDLRTPINEGYVTNPALYKDQEILDQWIDFGIYIGLKSGDYELIDKILSPLHDFHWQSMLYGVKVAQGDLEGAAKQLEMLTEENQNQIYFKYVQGIALEAMNDPSKEIELSSHDKDKLKAIAMSTEPASSYARSLYRQFTNEFIPIDLPSLEDFKDESDFKFIKADKSLESIFSIYPNPANDYIVVGSDTNVPIASVEIFTINGKKIYSRHVGRSSGKSIVDVSSLNNGVYLLTVTKDDGEKTIDKITIQH